LIFHPYLPNRLLHSFPTRRSSDLCSWDQSREIRGPGRAARSRPEFPPVPRLSVLRRSPQSSTPSVRPLVLLAVLPTRRPVTHGRSEEHTSELQSRGHLVCRLLLEK